MRPIGKLTNIMAVVGGIGVLNLGVSAVSLAVLVKRFSDIERQLDALYEEFQKDRSAYLRAGLIAAADAATAAVKGDHDNKRAYSLQAIDRLREARIHAMSKVRELKASGDNDLLLAHLSEAMQVDSVLIRCYIERDDHANAGRHLDRALVEYRDIVRIVVSRTLGDNRAVFFHPKVSDEDLWRFVGVRKWLSDRDVDLAFLLQETLFAERHNFWNQDIAKDIDAPAKRPSIRGRFSRKERDDLDSLPPHLLALAKSDLLIENYRRLEGFQAELAAIERLGLPVQEWEDQIHSRLAEKKIDLAEHDDYVLLVDEEWLAEQPDSSVA